MKRSLQVLIVLTLCSITWLPSYGQNFEKPTKPEDYVKIVKYYRYLNPDSAMAYVRLGIAFAKANNDLEAEAALLNQSGMIDDNAGRYKDSRNKYLQSEQLYRKIKNDKGLASTLIRLGVVEQRKGNYDKSLFYTFSAYKISEDIKDKLGMLEAHNVLAEAYYYISDFKAAFAQLDKAQKINAQIPLNNFTLNTYYNLGRLYIKLGDYNKAITYIEYGLAKSNRVEFNGFKINFLSLLAKAYEKKGETQQSIALLNEALGFSREIKNVIRELSSLLDLANIYKNINVSTSLRYFGDGLKIAERYKLFNQQFSILDQMSALQKANGNYKEAIELKDRGFEIAKKFYYDDMAKQISNLETAFDKEKANSELRSLQIENAKEQKFRDIMIAVAVGALLVMVIFGVYYFQSRKLNILLRSANVKLEKSNTQKDKFFSVVAHDIRSPLVSTVGILELINDDDIDADTRKEIVAKLINHCGTSLEVLDKLLKWGQMQIKGSNLNVADFNPFANVIQNISFLSDQAIQKNITIQNHVPANLVINADQNHFDFVVRNILANSIKFTAQNGAITITAVEDDGFIKFQVIDNGIGISKERIDKIFDLSSTSTKGTNNEKGTSLGLIICKEFISANHGDINIDSEIGKGTVLTFRIPGYQEKNLTPIQSLV